jgi:hypothetical protein
VEGKALGTLNGEPLSSGALRNGDVLGIGGVRLQFWLAPVPSANFKLREGLTWIGLFALMGLQVALVYWLAR